MTGHLPIGIIPDESPHKMGSVLLRFLPGNVADDVQGVILRVMEAHPELAKKMPEFTDSRRFKMPTIAGLDIFQSHIKKACEFIRTHMDSLKIARLQHNIPKAFKPSAIVHGAQTVGESEGYTEGRHWITPRITDFNCAKQLVTHTLISSELKSFSDYFTASNVEALAGAPLSVINLSRYVELRGLSARSKGLVSSASVLNVMHHPSSRSHIARTSIARLETDIRDFAKDENSTVLPVMKIVSEERLSSADGVDECTKELLEISSALIKLRQADSEFVRNGVSELLSFANGDLKAQERWISVP